MINLIRAELKKAISRRGLKLMALVALGMLVWISWSNHKSIDDSRKYIRAVERALDDPNSQQQSIRDGPGGKYPYFGPDVTEDEYRKQLESGRLFSVVGVFQATPILHAGNSHRVTLGVFGTVPGVLFAVLIASTFVGADFRWSYWKTAATVEPRRGRLILAKLTALWLLLAIGLVVLLGLSYGVNALFAQVYDLDQPIPSLNKVGSAYLKIYTTDQLDVADLLGTLGAAILSIGTYATFAAAAVVWARTSLAGPLASVGLLVLDGALITPRLTAIRHASPAQQIAFLLPDIPHISFDAVRGIWFERMDKIVSFSTVGPRSLQVTELSTIPDWRALSVLAAWIALGILIAVAGLRARDLPS